MTRIAPTLSLAIALLGATVNLAAANPQVYDQETQNRRAKCNNDCLFQAWPEGYCVNEPGCNCNHQDRREKWLCCMAERCEQIVLTDAMASSLHDCKLRDKPYEFDPEAVCGIKLTTSLPPTLSTSAPSASSTQTSAGVDTTASSAATTPSTTGTGTGTGASASQTTGNGAAQTSEPAGSGASVQKSPVVLGGVAGLVAAWGLLL